VGPVESKQKLCGKCHGSKSIDDFYPKGAGRWDSWCKPCRLAQKKITRSKAVATSATEGQNLTLPDSKPIAIEADNSDDRNSRPDATVLPAEDLDQSAHYRQYTLADGRVVRMTREQFDSLVEKFRILDRWASCQRA
jgi:hypothetical protein